jgi:hypothetical protein
MLVGIVLGVFGFGLFCWLLFTLAVYALPFYAAMTAGLAALQAGAGIIGALIVGVLAGCATFALGGIALAASRTSFIRTVVGMLYAAPAMVAGYHVSLALAGIGMSAAAWQQALAVLGGMIAGITAYSRLLSFLRPPARQGPAASSLAD